MKHFGNAEGFAYLRREAAPASPESILEMIATTVVDWQEKHPATQFGMKQRYYGLPAFRQFVDDVRDLETRSNMEKAYINCHAIRFQLGGRYWLGQYLKGLARKLDADQLSKVTEIADLYLKGSERLRRFADYNIIGKDEAELRDSFAWLEEAYHADKRITELFTSLKGSSEAIKENPNKAMDGDEE